MKILTIQYSCRLLLYIAIGILPIITISCQKSKDTRTSGETEIMIKITDVQFDYAKNIGGNLSSTKKIASSNPIESGVVKLNADLFLVAEMTAEPSRPVKHTIGRGINKLAALETTGLSPNIAYRVLVYNQNGDYVTERDYIYTQESNTPALNLDGDATYTFIVYSLNSTSPILPPVNNKNTLSTANVAITGNPDFLYFRRDLQLSGAEVNYLNVVLRHKFSQIATTVDASETGYNITNIQAAFTPHATSTVINLAESTIQRLANGSATAQFNVPGSGGAAIVTQTIPTIINAATNNTTVFTISQLTIGTVTVTNIVPFNDLQITPGVKYNLSVKLVPNDKYITYENQRAVLINGLVWMRHNLGSNFSANPDLGAQAIHGNFFRWGIKNHVGTPTALVGSWSAYTYPGASAWNSGTVQLPFKTSADPCPTGYRVPTMPEFTKLVNSTSQTKSGVSNSISNFSAINTFESLRAKGVKLTLPYTGWRNQLDGAINQRGNLVDHWASTSNGSPNGDYFGLESDPVFSNNYGRAAFQIRCIAINSATAIAEGTPTP